MVNRIKRIFGKKSKIELLEIHSKQWDKFNQKQLKKAKQFTSST